MSRKNAMAKFMVQVVLHDAPTAVEYDQLDRAMSNHGFLRELAGRKGAYQLPVGTYWCKTSMDAADVRLMATTAARASGGSFGILVVRSAAWCAIGLRPAAAGAEG